MRRFLKLLPHSAFFLAGVAAAALSRPRREMEGTDPAALADLRRSLAELEQRLSAHQADQAARCDAIDVRLNEHATRLNEHSDRLADVPSTAQIVTAMEQLLQKTMSALDERLVTQAHSIDVLRTGVAQTDGLLERVLESLDSLQGCSDITERAVGPNPTERPV